MDCGDLALSLNAVTAAEASSTLGTQGGQGNSFLTDFLGAWARGVVTGSRGSSSDPPSSAPTRTTNSRSPLTLPRGSSTLRALDLSAHVQMSPESKSRFELRIPSLQSGVHDNDYLTGRWWRPHNSFQVFRTGHGTYKCQRQLVGLKPSLISFSFPKRNRKGYKAQLPWTASFLFPKLI